MRENSRHDQRGEESVACIHQLFEAQVAATPNGVAVISDQGSVSYDALNRRANQVAHELLRTGAVFGAESLVGVLTSRSIDMIAAFLGVLKAGAAYIPLDPDYPAQRLAFLIADSGARICVVPRGTEYLREKLDCKLIQLRESYGAENMNNPVVDVTAANAAYVIYTSGSTGVPKGVTIEHRGLTNLMRFTRRQMKIGAGDRVLQFASLSFDAAIWEIFAALTTGAALVLGDPDSLLPGPSLQRLLQRHGVTIALLSPSVLGLLPSEGLHHLRIIVAGTEKCTADIVRRWAPGRRFFNAYGPTECSIYATILEVDEIGDAPPSIGYPVPGVQVYVLDESLRPVTDGQSGELCIGGIGVGRGYLNRAELTAERFVTIAPDDGAPRRIYRTGDRARLLDDGSLEFQGRLDFQVKIRGFRVELGEVETALEEHENVASAVVVEGRDARDQAELWAYYMCRGSSACATVDLVGHLSSKLPAYMVPTVFTRVDRWPLTANGKLDRNALPLPQRRRGDSPAGRAQEQWSATEQRIASICRELLGVTEIGATDNLYEIGLHSLLVAQLAWKVEQDFGATLAYREIFEGPTIAELAEKVNSKAQPVASNAIAPILPVAANLESPLSFAQESVWFLEKLHPENRAYQFQAVLSLKGRLDRRALQNSLNALVARHEILRTSFPVKEGRPFQRVHAPRPADLRYEDLTALPMQERLGEATRRIGSAGRRGFDIDRPPLIRWTLYQLDDGHHLLLHHEHHFLHDGWSYGVFLEELFELYVAFSNGVPPSLPLPAIQYRDFAYWQRAQVECGAYRNQLEYWLRQLHDPPAPVVLPTDRLRPAIQTFNGDQLRMALDRECYSRLAQASAEMGVTPYMWLQTVFQTLLYRYTGVTDICVGSGFANRRARELEHMLGMVINTVVIRGNFSDKPTFTELLQRFRRTIVEAADNQDVPFEKVVQALNPERRAGQPVLFSTFFDAYGRPYPRLSTAQLEITREDGVGNGTAKFDLVVLVVPQGQHGRDSAQSKQVDSALVIWEYNTDLFDRQTAQRMLAHFRTLLDSSLQDPACGVDELPICGSEERIRLLSPTFRGELLPYPRDATIHGLFEEQVRARPSATALVCEGQHVTYEALDARANQLANHLLRQGVEPEDLIGICAGRGVETVVGILGVLKAGGAYVPMDPEHPRRRLLDMIEDAKMPVVLTREAHVRCLSSSAAKLVCLDTDWTGIARESDRAPPTTATASSLAYVMYTSGSTGVPKGACIIHRGVVRLVKGVNYVELGPEEVTLHASPIAFDASTFELWGSLLNGGTLVLLPSTTLSLDLLSATVREQRVTTLWLTAALFHRMVDHHLDSLSEVRQLLAGGDVLSPDHVRKYLATLQGGRRLINGYGPTETTTFACCHVMNGESQIGASVAIGRPVGGAQVYVLDERMEPVPVGVAGELYIGGDGLARGYWKRPDLTAERFVDNPFQDAGRIYRTGDLVRWRPDAALEFLGRLDDQVKLRGFRIEPIEVERALLECSAATAAVVVCREDGRGEKRLVAYLSGDGDRPLDVEDLNNALRDRLPAYMIPAAIVVLDVLPLTASGKVDRTALPVPDYRHATGQSYLEPRSALERSVANIWRELLSVEKIGMLDNFFDLGGDSLLLVDLQAKMERVFRRRISIVDLFRYPTIRDLVRHYGKEPRTRGDLDRDQARANRQRGAARRFGSRLRSPRRGR